MSQELAGWTVVVTRPAGQADAFVSALVAVGAEPLVVPTLAIGAPEDGGAALRSALLGSPFDWVVVTSANGARRLRSALDETGAASPWVAAVGPRTAEVLLELGLAVQLVPERFVAEGLVDAFPAGPSSVLVVRPEEARDVVADGLRAKGHAVTEVVAYRTVAAPVSAEQAALARSADVVTFASPLSYRAYVEAIGLPTGQIVVSIGPVTSAAITDSGIEGVLEADPHTTDAMVEVLCRHRDGS